MKKNTNIFLSYFFIKKIRIYMKYWNLILSVTKNNCRFNYLINFALVFTKNNLTNGQTSRRTTNLYYKGSVIFLCIQNPKNGCYEILMLRYPVFWPHLSLIANVILSLIVFIVSESFETKRLESDYVYFFILFYLLPYYKMVELLK